MHDRLEQQLSPKLLGQHRKIHFASKPILPTNHTQKCKQIFGDIFVIKLHQKAEFLTGLRSLESMGLQTFNSKGLGDTYSDRRVSALTERNIDAVWDSVGRSPKKSIRRCSQ